MRFLIFLLCSGVLAQTLTTKPKIAIAKFTPKAPEYKKIDPTGEAFADMLITALFRTGKFTILEREILKELQDELKLAEEAPDYEGADFVVAGAITAFEPDYKGFMVDLGTIIKAGCLLSILFGWLKAEKAEKALKKAKEIDAADIKLKIKNAYVGIDLRVVSVKTREIVGATRISTITKDVKFAGALSALREDVAMAFAFSEYRNTPVEKAIYECLEKAINYLSSILIKS